MVNYKNRCDKACSNMIQKLYIKLGEEYVYRTSKEENR